MTRKDYNKVAAAVRDGITTANATAATTTPRDAGVAATRRIALSLAAAFAAENPRFDMEKFMDACGL